MRSRTLSVFLGIMAIVVATAGFGQVVRSEMIVSTDWLAERLGTGVVLVYAGNGNDYAKEHIPTARLLTRSDLLVETNGIPNELPDVADLERLFTRAGLGGKTRIVIYSDDPLLAARTWFTFDYLGHGHRTSVLDGGLQKWVKEGKTLTAEVPVYEPIPFEGQPNIAALTPHRAMKPMVRYRSSLGEALVMIDARPAAAYQGVMAGEKIDADRAGHIPGALNIPWQLNVTDTGEFRTKEELQKLYAAVPMNRGTSVIVYCRTGVEASMTYFVLRYLGLDPSLYDGSYYEWSRDFSVATK
jgi:thiosulfate/3-mercaptopyruvate sulfurtransferase